MLLSGRSLFEDTVTDIIIKKKNEVYVTVKAEPHINQELSDHFIYLKNVSSVHNSIIPILTSIPLQLTSIVVFVTEPAELRILNPKSPLSTSELSMRKNV